MLEKVCRIDDFCIGNKGNCHTKEKARVALLMSQYFYFLAYLADDANS